MSVTISNKENNNDGDKTFVKFDLVVGAYATNGVSLTAAQLGLGSIDILIAERAGGIVYSFDHTNSKMKAYQQSFSTASANIGANSILTTDGSVLLTGGGPTGVALYLDPDSNAGAMAMTPTGPLSIPALTFGITPPTMTLSGASFTGGSNTTAALAEVANGTNLSGTVRCIAIGV